MTHGFFDVPTPVNEPIRSYAPGSPEKQSLKAQLEKMTNTQIEIPIIIGGKEIRTGNMAECVMPHNHSHVLARYHQVDASHVELAANEAAKAWKEWSEPAGKSEPAFS